ncbi:pyruvyl transferase EpsO [Microbacterium sp. AK009]|uniref:polysaccharide pyruvyl transferase family protein n=1 Tax=Microbacterium sp. AK009 TaxID=2723068 RepID=UPI0015C78F2A|nr:polysaccharide pyruvyl transferase family protein [Microbacterium sp. AK009]NYF15530.1 pyruvyl transferase EpsO [Microbacterium sp. AK009]
MNTEIDGDSTTAWLSGIRTETRGRLKSLIGDSPVALIDIPTHMNVGDSLIWQGELNYLSQIGAQVIYQADHDRWDVRDVRKLPSETVILLHGGGNFGDLWPTFHDFRLRVIDEVRHHRVIQLPQTIKFNDSSVLHKTAAAIHGHPDFVLLVRDAPSFDLASEKFAGVQVEFMADMALGLEAPTRSMSDGDRPLVLARADQERAFDLSTESLGIDAVVRDWGDRSSRPRSWRLSRGPRRFQRGLRSLGAPATHLLDPFVELGYARMRRMNVANGVAAVGRASLVVTDRLHGHILAGLLGKPTVILDNTYGKIRGVFEATTHNFPDTYLVADETEARETILAIRSRS